MPRYQRVWRRLAGQYAGHLCNAIGPGNQRSVGVTLPNGLYQSYPTQSGGRDDNVVNVGHIHATFARERQPMLVDRGG